MSSGVGASIDFNGFIARPLVISAGGGMTQNRLLKPYLDQAYVSQESEGQELWDPVVARFELDRLAALPPKGDPAVLTITYPLNVGEAAPATMIGQAQVLLLTFPQMQAGIPKVLEVTWIWNDQPTYAPPT